MIQDDLADALRAALARVGVGAPDVVHLERPARREHGDWSSNVAMATAKPAGRNPRELAGELAEHLRTHPPAHVADVRVEGPGFVNFHLQPTWLHEVLRDVVEAGTERYATHGIGTGERVMIEF